MNLFQKLSTKLRIGACIIVTFFAGLSTNLAQAPSNTMRLEPFIDNNINGFYEYLPRNYSRDVNQRYPLLIFFHGYGDSGSTPDSTTLSKVLSAGTPKIIKNGTFPDSFYVAGKWHKFIVITPQIKDGFEGTSQTSKVSPGTIDALINYASSAYRVDNSRIYLAGLSMGGGIAWDYPASSEAAASRLAAIAVTAAATILDTTETDNIAEAFLPVMATHNLVDQVIPVIRTNENVDKLKNSKVKVAKKNKPNKPTLDPEPLAFYWNTVGAGGVLGDSHNSWSRTFEDILPGTSMGGNLRDIIGVNVYEWMLLYTRSAAGPLPLTWLEFSAKELNNSVVLHWSTSSEFNVKNFVVEKSNDGVRWSEIGNLPPVTGTNTIKEYDFIDYEPYKNINYYRIKQFDIDGKFTYSVVKKFAVTGVIATFKVFPNPFGDQITFNVVRPVSRPSAVFLKLVDARGAVLRNEKYTLESGNTQITLRNLQSISPGIYYTIIVTEDGTILGKEKIVKN